MTSVLWSDESEVIVYRSLLDFKEFHVSLKLNLYFNKENKKVIIHLYQRMCWQFVIQNHYPYFYFNRGNWRRGFPLRILSARETEWFPNSEVNQQHHKSLIFASQSTPKLFKLSFVTLLSHFLITFMLFFFLPQWKSETSTIKKEGIHFSDLTNCCLLSATAMRRKIQEKGPSWLMRRMNLLENYCSDLLRCDPSVTRSSEVTQFFMPKDHDLQADFTKNR